MLKPYSPPIIKYPKPKIIKKSCPRLESKILMQLYIRKDQKGKLIKLNKKLKVSIATMIREAIDLWLEQWKNND